MYEFALIKALRGVWVVGELIFRWFVRIFAVCDEGDRHRILGRGAYQLTVRAG